MQIDRERLAQIICRGGGYGMCVGFCHSKRCTEAIELYGHIADSILADIATQGFIIVPREPSENMQLHGRDAISNRISRKDDDATIWAEDAAACWQAMIGAAKGESE